MTFRLFVVVAHGFIILVFECTHLRGEKAADTETFALGQGEAIALVEGRILKKRQTLLTNFLWGTNLKFQSKTVQKNAVNTKSTDSVLSYFNIMM